MRASLWRHRDFDLLWAGQTVSRVGTEVSVLAVPLIAIQVLHASTFTVGTLTAMETLPFLLVGLPAGAWVDRLRRRRVLIVADGGRLLALASIPVASTIASVTLAHLFVVAFVTGVFTVFFDVAYQSYLPELVHRDQLVDGNAKLAASESSAHVVGPGLGGALIGAVGATTAVVADAVSYGISLVCIVAIRRPSERPVRHEHATLVADIRDGLHFVARDTRIRAVTACTATSNLFSGATMAVLLLLMTRVLGFDGTAIGIVFAVGGVGAVAGSVAGPSLARRFGVGRAIVWSIALGGVGPFCFAVATGRLAGPLLAFGQAAVAGTGVIYNVNQVSMRQAVCPPRLLGRMNASVRFVVWGALPLGGFLGGALGALAGIRATLWIAAVGQATAFLWLVRSPVPSLRTLPAPAEDDEGSGHDEGAGGRVVLAEPELGVITEAPGT